MQNIKDEYIKQIAKYKRELRECQQQKDHRKTLNIMYPTADLDAKMADKRRKLAKYTKLYEDMYNV